MYHRLRKQNPHCGGVGAMHVQGAVRTHKQAPALLRPFIKKNAAQDSFLPEPHVRPTKKSDIPKIPFNVPTITAMRVLSSWHKRE